MLQKSIFILLFLLTFAFSSYAQESCNKLTESSLGISFCAPPKWTIVLKEGRKYQTVFGEEIGGLTPTMNIQAGTFSGSLSKYVKAGVDYLLQNYKTETKATSVELESQTNFTAGSNRGFRVVYNSVYQEGLKLRTIQYAFNGKGNTKIVITATMPLSDKDVLEKVFDDAVKTIQVKK